MKRQLILTLICAGFFLFVNAATAKDAANPICMMKTTMGDITLELFVKQAPETVQNFIDLAEGRKETRRRQKTFL